MNKRIVSIAMVIMLCLSLFSGPAAAAVSAATDAVYSGGVVTVSGEGFASGSAYIIRIVNTAENSIAAMGQATADGSGKLSASVTTGILGRLSDYTVYVNSLDGYPAALDNSIESGENYRIIYNGNGNTGGTVPVDGKSYRTNETVTILGNVNGLTRSGYQFSGWTKIADDSAQVYNPGSTLIMNTADIVLYAKWTAVSSPGSRSSGSAVVLPAITSISPTQGPAGTTVTINGANLGNVTAVKFGSQAASSFKLGTGAAMTAVAPEGSGTVDITVTNSSGTSAISAAGKFTYTEEVVVPTAVPVTAAPPAPPVTTAPGGILTDISGHWAENAINSLVARGVVSGYPDNTFRPENQITRAEFATMVVKTFELPVQAGKVFADTGDSWAKDYISTAYAAGIISGYSEDRFGPNDLITREQMAVMAAKAANLDLVSEEISFTDSQSISSWAREAVAATVKAGIIKGYPDNTFRPQGNATRAEAVTVIVNALQ